MFNGLYRYGYYSFWLGYSIQDVPTEVQLGTIKVSVSSEQDEEGVDNTEKKVKPESADIESSMLEELLIHLKCKEVVRKEVFAIRDSISRYIRLLTHWLTYSLTHSLAYSPYLLAHSYLLTHSSLLIHSLQV